MTESAGSRRMRLLEYVAEHPGGSELEEAAAVLGFDERTIRRDTEFLQTVLQSVAGIQLLRGRLMPLAPDYRPRRWIDGAAEFYAERAAMADAALRLLPDATPVILTAGRTTLAVASAIRQASVASERPNGLIVFTNSLPALLELIAGGVPTGLIGEVYDPDDCAFHAHEMRSRFQASIAVVGASGISLDAATGALHLCSDRMEEAAFMRHVLTAIPEIVVVAESSKIGRRHPWSFTADGLLTGKTVHIITTTLRREQADALAGVAETARRVGIALSYEEAIACAG